ncbi:MAG: hypothetical protein D8M58_13845 [Calditrichaeota bacterium]|nr:MAG: hypothetical protein DWQ03_15085 [Calditrichota bacterium]MBL1206482.1 hypothetical protein [Calditrichota bacterium]NOG46309.1 hypothetical protein [Calditrichota bacterium]
MDINKIFVTVDNQNYSGLYWLTETEGNKQLSVSYAGVKRTSKLIDSSNTKTMDEIAKTMLSELLVNMK